MWPFHWLPDGLKACDKNFLQYLESANCCVPVVSDYPSGYNLPQRYHFYLRSNFNYWNLIKLFGSEEPRLKSFKMWLVKNEKDEFFADVTQETFFFHLSSHHKPVQKRILIIDKLDMIFNLIGPYATQTTWVSLSNAQWVRGSVTRWWNKKWPNFFQ